VAGRPGTSPFVGIYWHANHRTWLVERRIHVGEFGTLGEAVAAYRERFGAAPEHRRPRALPVARQPRAYRKDAPRPRPQTQLPLAL
jgi:hypothetical protein